MEFILKYYKYLKLTGDTMNTPYTYLIGWSILNNWYYGVSYSKNCHPNDLWNIYFTSSKYVKLFREKYGEPDVIEIRKTFNNVDSARLWESKVLTRLNVLKNEKWLNKTNNKSVHYIRTEEQNKQFSEKMKGRKSPFKGKKHSEKTKLLISEANKGKNVGIKRNFTDEWKNNISLSRKGKPGHIHYDETKKLLSEYAKEKNFGSICKGRVWINNGTKNIRIYPEQLYLYPEYILGRLIN